MNKTIISVVIAIVVVIAAFYAFNNYIYTEKQGDGGLVSDYKQATYYISGAPVYLNEGDVTYFGNEARGDIDGDGDEDIAFLLVQQPGGSGSFYYLAGAINEGGKYKGTSAMFIGDRIAPQTTEYHAAVAPQRAYVVVNYADRNPTDPMTAQPSVGKSLYAMYDRATNSFGEWVKDFEGEAR